MCVCVISPRMPYVYSLLICWPRRPRESSADIPPIQVVRIHAMKKKLRIYTDIHIGIDVDVCIGALCIGPGSRNSETSL